MVPIRILFSTTQSRRTYGRTVARWSGTARSPTSILAVRQLGGPQPYSYLLDKLDHLFFLDDAGAVLIKLTEALVEVLVVEVGTIRHFSEGVSHERFSFFLIEVAVSIRNVLSSDLIDALGYHVVNFRVVSHRIVQTFTTACFIRLVPEACQILS